MNLRNIAKHKILDSIEITTGLKAPSDALITNGKRTNLPFYQSSCAMPLAKKLGLDSVKLANDIAMNINLNGLADVKVVGPGFIEIYFSNSWIAIEAGHAMREIYINKRLSTNKTVVVDYSGPNLAKEMHIGHLRSTIIGDCMARVLEHAGHKVIRQNHVGDWGTPFAMLLTHYNDVRKPNQEFTLKDLESFYSEGRIRFDEEPEFAERARANVVKLQSKDPDIIEEWIGFKELSMMHANDIYNKLNVSLTDSHVKAESWYQNRLQETVDDLKDKGIATVSEGATVVFLEDSDEAPVVIQKSDGAFLYITTDIAAIKYRAEILHADRIMYFVDQRQSLHLKQLFYIAKKAGYINDHVIAEHLSFGTMTDKGKTPFMSRMGNSIKLNGVLDEGVRRAKELILKKNATFTEDELEEISRKVGIGAIKYSDLCKTRTNDYVFDWDLMLSFEGNTAPYLQYAYTRIQSIFLKAGMNPFGQVAPIVLETEIEEVLATKLLQFNEVLEQVEAQAMPHLLCTYLFETTKLFMQFYESCPILKDDVPEYLKISRIRLAGLMSKTLYIGLDLLGIEVMNKM